jgi:hypothetical protein
MFAIRLLPGALFLISGCCTFCGTDAFVRAAQQDPTLVFVTLGWEIVETLGGSASDATKNRVMLELEKSKTCATGYVFERFVGNTGAHYIFRAHCAPTPNSSLSGREGA